MSLPWSQVSRGFPVALRMESESPPHLTKPLISHLFSPLSPVFQSHWVAVCSGNVASLFLSSLYTFCSLPRVFLLQILTCLDYSHQSNLCSNITFLDLSYLFQNISLPSHSLSLLFCFYCLHNTSSKIVCLAYLFVVSPLREYKIYKIQGHFIFCLLLYSQWWKSPCIL